CGVALINLHTHHGAFPSTEQEGCKRAGVEIGPNRVGALRLADAGLKRLRPRGENPRESLAHEAALVSELGAKIANQATLGVTLSGNGFGERFEIAPQPIERRNPLVAQQPKLRSANLPITVEDRNPECFLALKVIVKRAFGHPSGIGDVL